MPAAKKTTTRRKTKAETVDLATAASAVEFANALTIDQIVGGFGKLTTTVQNSLASLGSEMMSKIEESKRLDAAIAEKTRRIEELVQSESAAIEYDALVNMIEVTKAEWDEEQRLRAKQQDELEADFAAQQTKRVEQAQYDYNQLVARFNNEFEAQKAASERAERIRKEDLERTWAEREEALKEQEEEVTNLRQQVADFDGKLKTEVAEKVKETEARVSNEYKHQLELLNRDTKAQLDLAHQQVKEAQMLLQREQEANKILAEQAKAADERCLSVTTNALNVDAERRRADSAERISTATGGSKRS